MLSSEMLLLLASIKMLNDLNSVPADAMIKIQFNDDADLERGVSELLANNRKVDISTHNFAFKVRGNQLFFWVNL